MAKLTSTLFIPALNEIDGLKAIMPKIDKSWVDQILIIDGNSNDGTVDFAKSQGYEIHVQSKPGLRQAYNEGFQKVRGDIVITFSPDGNCIPEFIPKLIEEMNNGYDMVIASRYNGSAKSYDDGLVTGVGNKFFNIVISQLHGFPYTDCMGMFRAYRTNCFYDLGLDREDSYRVEKLFFTVLGCEPLLSVRAAKMKLKIAEIPADEPARCYGKRKLQIFRWGAGYLCQFILEYFSNKYRKRQPISS